MSMNLPLAATRWLAVLLLALACLCWPGKAAAQSCWVSGSFSMSFGTVAGAGASASSTSQTYTCQSASQTTYYRLCFYLGPGQFSGSSVNPRYMYNYSASTNNYMAYYLYSDAALTQLLGPVGGGYTTYTWTLAVPGGNTQTTNPVTVYGRAPSGQTLAAGSYQEQSVNGTLYYRYSSSGYPADCTTGGSGGGTASTASSGVVATYADACYVSTATDLSFGSVASLASAQNQVSAITLHCPSSTPWDLGLNNGSNANGSTRRMTDGSGHYITYLLYRDSARSTPWGNTVGTDTVHGTGTGSTQTETVYGQVPAQSVPAGGTYSDTVTVTLTY